LVKKPHISYSELKDWASCPHYHHLVHEQKLTAFEGNIYTAFGTALHEVCERTLVSPDHFKDPEKIINLFKKSFVSEIKSLPEDEQKKAFDQDLMKWRQQGIDIIPEIYTALSAKFGKMNEDWHVLKAEEQLYEEITETDHSEKKFKGFIDLVVLAGNKIHLIDWKSCSWGWDARKKSDKYINYQLVFYKHFYARKHHVPIEDIETHFVLFKRTAKKGNKVEFVRVTAGKKRIENALNLLTKALYNIEKGNHIKNKLACDRCSIRFGKCPFKQTEHCR